MKTEQFCVILCHPDESRNIGSVCRAMANNDILDLRIVGKKSDYDEYDYLICMDSMNLRNLARI